MTSPNRAKFWHLNNKHIVYKHFAQTCQDCKKQFKRMRDSVVHHKTYKHKGGIYSVGADELIKADKITLLCHACHEDMHSRVSIDGITRILKKQEK